MGEFLIYAFWHNSNFEGGESFFEKCVNFTLALCLCIAGSIGDPLGEFALCVYSVRCCKAYVECGGRYAAVVDGKFYAVGEGGRGICVEANDFYFDEQGGVGAHPVGGGL